MPDAEPTGIGPDRAFVDRIENATAVLHVGPSRTPLHVAADELPHEAGPGTWVVLDLQTTPPLVLSIDRTLTSRYATG